MGQAPIPIPKQPPALRESKGQGNKVLNPGSFVEHQQAVALQQPFRLAHGSGHTLRGMEHIGRQHQVIATGCKGLGRHILGNIQHPKFTEGAALGQGLLGLVYQGGRNIGEGVMNAGGMGIQGFQHRKTGSPRAATNLQNAEGLLGRGLGGHHRRGHGGGGQVVVVIHQGIAAIDPFHLGSGSARKENLEGIAGPAQDVAIAF